MGNFNFECAECGWGEGGDGEDGRDYFGAECQVIAKTKSGKEVVLNGTYSGYGCVELPGGQEFYLKQFEEYWAGWLTHTGAGSPFAGGEILCECCMRSPPPLSQFSLNDFQTVAEALRVEAPAAPVSAALMPATLMPAAPEPKKTKAPKAPKPKALTKDQLAAKVAELEAEVARLKPMEERLLELDKAYTRLQEANATASRRLKNIQEALWN